MKNTYNLMKIKKAKNLCLFLNSRRVLTKIYCSPTKPMNFITASTGSGKTYSAGKSMLKHASNGFVCIMAFPTKVLVHENFELLQKLQKENDSFKDVRIEMMTYFDAIPSAQLLHMFFKGSLIIVTVHMYIISRGDFFNFSVLLYFMNVFQTRVKLFIDESHLFFNSEERVIPITNGFKNEKNFKNIIEKIDIQQGLYNFQNFDITKGFLYSKKDTEGIFSFAQPTIYSDDFPTFQLINEDLLYFLINPTGYLQNPSFSIEKIENQQDSSLLQKKSHFFEDYDIKTLKVTLSEPFIGPSYVVHDIILDVDQIKLNDRKLNFKKKLKKIINYNTYIFFIKALEYNDIYNVLLKKLREVKRGELSFGEILTWLPKITLSHLNVLFNKPLTVDNKLEDWDLILKKVRELELDFLEILRKNNFELELIKLEDSEEALLVTFLLSPYNLLITHYPTYNGELLKDKKTFDKIVESKLQLLSLKKKKEKALENKTDESSDDSDYQQLEDESSPFSNEDDSEVSLTYTSNTPFTTAVLTFNALTINTLTDHIRVPTLLTTATPSNFHREILKKNWKG
uniref:Putative RecG-like helicase n=1 Tax=Treubaria triappendiculata TaxID=1755147 RepID=A0A0S2LMQ3_TRETR|nr:putative RecG-like helicase [Treubaria triappendiculata]ALO62684.1 putative RecG-like helicase [Treubaria triappendiculata]